MPAFPDGGDVPVQSAEALGRLLADHRRQRGLRQDELAEWAGFARDYMSDLEHGRHARRLDRIFDLLDVLGLELVIRRKRGAAPGG